MAQVVENGEFYEVIKTKSKIEESTAIIPTFREGRAVQDTQTHAGVSIAANSWNNGAWIDSHVEGSPLTKLSIRASMTSGTGMQVAIDFSEDGVNFFSTNPNLIYDGTATTYTTNTDIDISSRFFRLAIKNKDATNPKTTSAYVRLKA